MEPIKITNALVRDLKKLRFAEPVTHVYTPLEYASKPHRDYLQRYGSHRPDYVLLGMNPGPFGMVQTGVPFGEISSVRDWLGIDAPVVRPRQQHPKRLIEGFDCTPARGQRRAAVGLGAGALPHPQGLLQALRGA